MKKLTSLVLSSAVLASSLFGLSSCNNNKYPGFKTTEGGLIYKLFPSDKQGEKVTPKSVVTVGLKYEGRDTLFMDSYAQGGALKLAYPISAEPYAGSLDEGFAMLAENDSAVFITDAKMFFEKVAKQPMPSKLKEGDKLHFYIKVYEIWNEQELAEMRKQNEEQMRQLTSERQKMEIEELAQYLKENNVKVKPTASGLYYIETQKGSGKKPKAGDKVTVEYEGKTVDGKTFDASKQAGKPFEFVVGQGQVIPGWDEGLMMMGEGAKGKLIVPSNLGYGERGVPPVIPPYSVLIFDVELVKIN